MTEPQHRYVILTAVQFDETADLALHEAVRIAQRDPAAELHVIHCVAPGLAAGTARESSLVADAMVRAPQTLKEYVERACAGTSLRVKGHIRAGDPVEVILQTAADVDADIIVLGTHRRTGIGKLLLGSVAEKVLREAHSPVLIATPKAYDHQAAADAIEPPCPECVARRQASGDESEWCERHSRARLRVHVYSPSDRPPRASLLG